MPKDLVAETESTPELSLTSESEQMYLITVARSVEDGNDGPVPISRIAGALDVSVPSANEMIRKLDTRGLVTYEPYRGVRLSETGHQIAGQVLRTRRLWATFLVDHLGFGPADADEQACQLEHATTPEAVNRLDAFLGNPAAGPLGHPIPAATVLDTRRPKVRLGELAVGASAEVISVAASDQVAAFLSAEGVVVGSRVVNVASGSSGLLVDVDGDVIHLDHAIVATIEVLSDGATLMRSADAST
jgi:DtxR family Mn-dependent transcriptional regulator